MDHIILTLDEGERNSIILIESTSERRREDSLRLGAEH